MRVTVDLPEFDVERPEQTLNKRQMEVMGYIVQGWTNEMIAKAMKVSPDYEKYIVTQCMNKVGCDNRVQLAVWFMTQKRYSELEETRLQISVLNYEIGTLKRLIKHLKKARAK